jgi:mRNA interferase MazF
LGFFASTWSSPNTPLRLLTCHRIFIRRVGPALFCPITSQLKGYPFGVPLPAGSPVSGAVGADRVKSLDCRARKAARIGAISEEVVARVLEWLQTLLARGE